MHSFSRRESFKLISGVLSVPVLSYCTSQPEVLRFGIIGYGFYGAILANLLLDLDKRIVIHSVCDICDYRLRRAMAAIKGFSGNTPHVYVDYTEMLQQESGKLDVVIVAQVLIIFMKNMLLPVLMRACMCFAPRRLLTLHLRQSELP